MLSSLYKILSRLSRGKAKVGNDLDSMLSRLRWAIEKIKGKTCPICGNGPPELNDINWAPRCYEDMQGLTFHVRIRYRCTRCKKHTWGMVLSGKPDDRALAMAEIEKLCRADDEGAS